MACPFLRVQSLRQYLPSWLDVPVWSFGRPTSLHLRPPRLGRPPTREIDSSNDRVVRSPSGLHQGPAGPTPGGSRRLSSSQSRGFWLRRKNRPHFRGGLPAGRFVLV